MSDPYLGEIDIFAFGFAPKGWAVCAGQLLPINQNQALFSVLGTTYGGDGIRTFALPDLRGRVPIGQGAGGGLTPRSMGEVGGEANHTLLVTEIPAHTHTLNATAGAPVASDTATPANTVVLAATTSSGPASPFPVSPYAPAPAVNPQPMNATAIGQNSGGQPHGNMMPYLALNFCISLVGIFPTQN